VYELGKFIGSLIVIVGSVHFLGFLINRVGKVFERKDRYIEDRRQQMVFEPTPVIDRKYDDLSRKVDWLIQQKMAESRRFEEPPIDATAYYTR